MAEIRHDLVVEGQFANPIDWVDAVRSKWGITEPIEFRALIRDCEAPQGQTVWLVMGTTVFQIISVKQEVAAAHA